MSQNDRVEELEEKVEELTEELEKVKTRKSGEAKKEEVGEIQDQIKDAAEESGVSRRKFMKMIGGGAAGLSAAAVLPSVSGFTFKDDSSFKFGNMSSGQTNVEVGTGGDLNMHGNDIGSVGNIEAETITDGTTSRSYEVQNLERGDVATPKSGEDDLQEVLNNNVGGTVDLQGQTFTLNDPLELVDGITLINGTITHPGWSSGETLVSTPDEADYEDIVLQNIEIDGKGDVVHAMKIRDCQKTRIVNCHIHDCFQGGIRLYGKHSSGTESNGPIIANCQIRGMGGNGPGIYIGVERDYAFITGCAIGSNNFWGMIIEGENTQVTGTSVSGAAGCIKIDGTETTKSGNKTKLFGVTANHGGNGPSVRAIDVERLHINGLQALIADEENVDLDGVQYGTVEGCTLARPGSDSSTRDCIALKATNRDCKNNVIRNNTLEVYGASVDVRDGIREVDADATGNVIRDNEAFGVGYTLNSTTNVKNNITI